MDFRHGEDPLLFQETVRDFLAKECTPEAVRAIWEAPTGRSAGLWKKLAEIGVAGLLAPEANGGMGFDETTLVLLLEEAGRTALPEPVIGTAEHLVGEPQLAREVAARAIPALAYEMVRDAQGGFPLLAPMSLIAGRLAIQVGAHLLTLPAGGNGTLLAGWSWGALGPELSFTLSAAAALAGAALVIWRVRV